MDVSSATVFIVDDDASARRGLSRLLASAGCEVRAFGSPTEFLQTIDSLEVPACLILDVRMPDMSGPEVQEQMIRKGVSLPIVFLTGEGDIPTTVRAMKQGAVDFLTKPVDEQALLDAVALATAHHAQMLTAEQEKIRMQRKLASLSPREYEIMEYVIGGCLNKQIAALLGISEKTVKVHRGRVMEKLAVRSLAELVRLCGAAGVERKTC